MSKFAKGIVAGKFCPPHRGHHRLIEAAVERCDHVDVFVIDNPAYPIPARLRADWLRAAHPAACVRIVTYIGQDDDSVAWAAYAMKILCYAPDAVFSSEPYGITWAEAMGAPHVMVDLDRDVVPISATQVRADVLASWGFLSDEVKAGLAVRIVVAGAESTGTTTLATELAEALGVPWVPEIGRYYTETAITDGGEWRDAGFYRIGKLQQHYEAAMAMRSRGVIVCDTNSWAAQLWQRRYLGATTDEMARIASRDRMDLLIITGDEIPFVQDGWRDGEHIRHEMHQWFLEAAEASGVPWLLVQGSREERLAAALPVVQRTIASATRL